ncbi:nonstructural protein [Sigmofec virus UA08Rod_6727]|uniref:Nonstructural protein n=1 Tax=Sigmofec virus UA08Rod_6727 TaxID=2929238 RepID=A0A976R6T5_9VIRU|nr:nonstructural protein [Sigmofec virus UA08Rod_6727]
MKIFIYTIYDKVTSKFGDIILSHNEDDMKRKIAYAMQSNPYKGDLAVYYLGTYDVDSGKIESIDPKFIVNVIELYSEADHV